FQHNRPRAPSGRPAQVRACLTQRWTTSPSFYPLWFTFYQSHLGSFNQLAGPERVTPVYKLVVLINVDTLYASAFLDLTAEPIIVDIPKTRVIYSILSLDPYGDIFQSGIEAGTPGTYALIGPGFTGKIPKGV